MAEFACGGFQQTHAGVGAPSGRQVPVTRIGIVDFGRTRCALVRRCLSATAWMSWPRTTSQKRAHAAVSTAGHVAAPGVLASLLVPSWHRRWTVLEVTGSRARRYPVPARNGGLGRSLVPRVGARRASQLGPQCPRCKRARDPSRIHRLPAGSRRQSASAGITRRYLQKVPGCRPQDRTR